MFYCISISRLKSRNKKLYYKTLTQKLNSSCLYINGMSKNKIQFTTPFTLENKLRTFRILLNIKYYNKTNDHKRNVFSIIKGTLLVKKAVYTDWNGAICT